MEGNVCIEDCCDINNDVFTAATGVDGNNCVPAKLGLIILALLLIWGTWRVVHVLGLGSW